MKHRSLTLFLLGIGSFVVGPFAGVPGIIMGWPRANKETLEDVGYALCWIGSIMFTMAFLVFGIPVLLRVTMPFWWHGVDMP